MFESAELLAVSGLKGHLLESGVVPQTTTLRGSIILMNLKFNVIICNISNNENMMTTRDKLTLVLALSLHKNAINRG